MTAPTWHHYAVELTIGDWSVTLERDPQSEDPDDVTDGVWALDGLTSSWQQDDYPGQHEPADLQFGLWTQTPAALPNLDAGTLVRARVTTSSDIFTATILDFQGRITDASATPARRGLAFEVIAVDHLAELGALWIGNRPWPYMDPPRARLERIEVAAGIDLEQYPTQSSPYVQSFAALDVDNRSAWDLITTHLEQLTGQQWDGWDGVPPWVVTPEWTRRSVVAYRLSGNVVYRYIEQSERSSAVASAFVLQRAGGVVSLVWSPGGADRATLLEADWLELGSARWTKDKTLAINRAEVTATHEGFWSVDLAAYGYVQKVIADRRDAQESNGIITEAVESQLYHVPDAQSLARMHLGDPYDSVPRWVIRELVIVPEAVPDGQWLPIATEFLPKPRPKHSVVIVHGIPAAQNLTGTDALAGVLIGGRLDIAGGRMRITATITPKLPRPHGGAASDALKWEDLPAAENGQPDWNELDPTITWADLRMTRDARS